MFIISPPCVHPGIRVHSGPPDFMRRKGCRARAGAGYGPNGRVCALTTSHAHHRMTTVREGASLEASTASPAAGAAGAAGAIVAALARAGTRLVFGVPGGGPNLDVVGAAEAAGLRFVLAHGETAATVMAATSADLTGAPGAGVVTRGPGLASAVNGMAHAALDRLPVVVIADTVADARISHQRIDQAALGRSVAKAAVTVSGPPTAAAAVATALAAPPGPVIANMDDSAADQSGPPGRLRVENGVEAQAQRAAEDTAARAGRAILA